MTMKRSGLTQPAQDERAEARLARSPRRRIRRAGRARRRREAQVPRDEVPHDGAEQRRRGSRRGRRPRRSISPLLIVLATAVPTTNAATKLKNAAQTTATPGDRTRVETTVAMELAAVVKAVDEVEDERDEDDHDDEVTAFSIRQACLIEMDSSTLLASSM